MHVGEISGKSLTNIKSIFTESFSGDFIFGGEEGLAVFLKAYRKLKKKNDQPKYFKVGNSLDPYRYIPVNIEVDFCNHIEGKQDKFHHYNDP